MSKIMNSLHQKIINFIKQNQPVTEKQLKEGLGITYQSCREERRKLCNAGLIYISCGCGAFVSRSDFEYWLSHGGGHEKISASAKQGIHNALTDTTAKKRVIDFLSTQDSPVGAGEIAIACNLSQKPTYRILEMLSDDGTIFHDGRVKGRQYLIASSGAQWPAGSCQHSERKIKAFCRYNPNKNGVVQEYMASPARARLMAVYGRVG
ncbi:TPA: hypothetical protein ACTW8Y_000487 [Raoultella ornithinolytica]